MYIKLPTLAVLWITPCCRYNFINYVRIPNRKWLLHSLTRKESQSQHDSACFADEKIYIVAGQFYSSQPKTEIERKIDRWWTGGRRKRERETHWCYLSARRPSAGARFVPSSPTSSRLPRIFFVQILTRSVVSLLWHCSVYSNPFLYTHP